MSAQSSTIKPASYPAAVSHDSNRGHMHGTAIATAFGAASSVSDSHHEDHQRAGVDFSLIFNMSRQNGKPKLSPSDTLTDFSAVDDASDADMIPFRSASQRPPSPIKVLKLHHPNDLKKKSPGSRKCRMAIAIVVGLMLLGVAAFLAVHFVLVNQPITIPVITPVEATLESMPNLKVSGRQIVYPNGTVFYGRGANMGSWFIMDSIFSGFTGVDEFDFFNITDRRFGQNVSRSLMHTYIDNAMTSTDYDLLRLMGFNFVRFPLHFRNFQDKDGNWINYTDRPTEIDFSRLDYAISNFTSRGLYVQLDLHIWYSRDILYEGISKNDIGLATNDPTLYAECVKWRGMAATFLRGLTEHVVGVPGILGIELVNEPVPSYENLLSQVLYDAVRSADPDRIIVRHFGIDRVAPAVYNWTNIVYGFHTYEGDQDLSGYKLNALNKTAEAYDLPYYVSEVHFADPDDFSAAVNWTFSHFATNVNVPMYAIWTYKAVNMDEWALVNYDSSYIVDIINDSVEEIEATWKQMPSLDLATSLSSWGRSLIS
ncbi:hypothetical protein HDU83_008555 [Entophlyctis luteolus]|nr:hypothetical protein HDU83_008555 [Entophlyctis luteolus]